jgi:hypothetical protein
MTDDLVKRLRERDAAGGDYCTEWGEAADRIEKLEAALIAIKAMHHDGGVDDVEERDDRTYFIVCEALEATK